MNRISTTLLLAIAFTILFSNANAQIAGWFFKDKDGTGNYTINTTGNEVTREATLIGSNLASTPSLSRGAGIVVTTNNTRTFNGLVNVVPANTTTGLTLTEAENGNVYYEFTLFPATDKVISIDQIKFRFRKGGATSPDKVQFKYYVGTTSSSPAKEDFVVLGTPITSTSTITDGVDQQITGINLVSALQNIGATQKIVIRAYWYGSTNNTNGVIAFGKSLNNAGTVAEYGALSIFDTNAALPVKLTAFTAKPKTSAVELNWTTASEQNNSHFEVLRSATGKPDLVIGKVTGKGTTSTINNYHFTDYSPLSSAYYQLRQVDFNGDSQTSDVVAVAGNFSTSSLTASAVDGKFSGSYQSDKTQKAKLTIVDINGKLLVSQSVFLNKGFNQFQLPLTASKGLYLARLVEDNGGSKIAKFIY